MAYGLFNSGAAASYAQSFRPVRPYGGFDEIKSTVATDTLTKIPFLNFQAEVDMAKAALQEVGANARQKNVSDTSLEINKMRYDKDGDKSAAKKAALSRLMGSGASMAKRGGGGVGSRELMGMLAQRRSPLDHALNVTQKNSALDADNEARMTAFNATLASGIKNMPEAPSGGGEITVQGPAPTQVRPVEMSGLKSDVDVDEIMRSVLEARQTAPTQPTEPLDGGK